MSNLRDNIVLIIAIVTAFIILTGVTVACGANKETESNKEMLIASWVGYGIEAKAWNFTYPEKCNQIRYYQPLTLPDEDDIPEGCELEDYIWNQESPNTALTEPYNASNNPTGFYVVNLKFPGNTTYTEDNPYTEILTNPGNGWDAGEWIVVLLKNGDVADCTTNQGHDCCNDCSGCTECCNDPCLLANSYRLHCPVEVPIPEFQTIALPIAAILGIMFILQSRRRKED